MKIDSINPITSITTIKQESLPNPNKEKEAVKEKPAAVYEKSHYEAKATYEKPAHVYDKAAVEKLKAESKKNYESLRRLVEELLRKQGKTIKLIDSTEVIEIDEETRLEAQKMIAEDGPLGIEAVSQRIVDFAIAISGGDKSKLDTLKAAIDEGFKQAKKILGELPDISKQTYNLIMEKLDKWAGSDE